MSTMSNNQLKWRLRGLGRRGRLGSVYAERIVDELFDRGLYVTVATIMNSNRRA